MGKRREKKKRKTGRKERGKRQRNRQRSVFLFREMVERESKFTLNLLRPDDIFFLIEVKLLI